MLDWLQWALDVEKLEPRSKYAWVIPPVSFLILFGAVGGFFFLWRILSGWYLAVAGILLACGCLVAEYFLVARLLPGRIRRPR